MTIQYKEAEPLVKKNAFIEDLQEKRNEKKLELKLEKEKEYLEYFFNNNDYNTDFTDFSDQYKYLTLCTNISERRMCDDCSIDFVPCKRHLSVSTSNGI